MKPLPVKTYLVRAVLASLASVFLLIGYLLSAKSIPFFPTMRALTVEQDITLEVALGTISLAMIGVYLSFICSYLQFEFYGFKAGFYNALSSVIGIPLMYGILDLLHRHALDPMSSRTDELISELFAFRLSTTVSFVLACLTGFIVTLMFAGLIKKIMRNYFMFVRFPIASILGFGGFVAVHMYLNNFRTLAIESMPLEALPLASQFLAMIIVSVIPLYLLRLVFGMFRGWSGDDNSEKDKHDKNAVFKAKPADVALPATPVAAAPTTTVIPTPPSAPKTIVPNDTLPVIPAANDNLGHTDAEEEEDYTVSKKIQFPTPAKS